MLTVTAKAAEKLKEALEMEGKLGYGLRVVAQAGDCSCCGPAYALLPEPQAQPHDAVITAGEVQLFIDPQSLELLRGATLDYIEHPELGEGFTIDNPNVQQHPGGCGCGGHDHGHSPPGA